MANHSLRAVIADDEPLARRGVRQMLKSHADVEVVGEARNGQESVQMVRALKPDLVFLDVEMPGLDGFEVLTRVHGPAIIFVTAYDNFAVGAFDVDAVDYLLKPLTQKRFDEALVRVRRKLRTTEPDGGRMVVGDAIIEARAISCIEAADYYAAVHYDGRKTLVRESLDALEAKLDQRRFVRTHRGYIVNLGEVIAVRSSVVLRDGRRIPVSRRRKRRVEAALQQFAITDRA